MFEIEVIRCLRVNLFLGQLRCVMPVAGRQNWRTSKQRRGMNQQFHMLLIGILGDHFSSLDNDVQPLLKPMYIRRQADEMLKIRLAQDAIGNARSTSSLTTPASAAASKKSTRTTSKTGRR
jgi:hypothetical protein